MLLAVPHHEYNIYGMACKFYMLLHTKQLFVDSHINCLVTRKQCFKHFTSYHDGFTAFFHILGNWVDVTHYNFSHLKYLEIGLWLAFKKKSLIFKNRLLTLSGRRLYTNNIVMH